MRLLFLAAMAAATSFGATAEQFQTLYQEALHLEEKGQVAPLEKSSNYRYLFVNGFLSEVSHNRFEENFSVLSDAGHPPELRDVLQPSSQNDFETNRPLLQAHLEKIARKGAQRLVLFAHSKGAAESLAAVLTGSRELRQSIAGIYLIQGALQGSPFADLVMNEGIEPDNQLPTSIRNILSLMLAIPPNDRLPLIEKVMGVPLKAGLTSLTQSRARAYWKDTFSRYWDNVAEISDRVFYIQGWENPDEAYNHLRIPAHYIQTYYGANDGLVPLKNQVLDGIGTSLATFHADHITLTGNRKPGAELRRMRRAWTYAAARLVIDEDHAREEEYLD